MSNPQPMRRRGGRAGERGFTYIALLIAIMIMGVVLAAVGDVWATAQQREKERQLLFVGGEFRRAIASYSAQDAATRYPLRLEDLLLDPRVPAVRRHLRRIYVDPITGTAEWGLLKGRSGEIYGVYSLSDAETLKRANFAPEDAAFEGRSKYSEWIFSPVQTALPRALSNAAAAAAARQMPQRQ